MKKRLIVSLALLLVSCGSPVTPGVSPSPTETPATTSTPSVLCQDMTHVYHPARLIVLATCVSVKGVVQYVRVEADGDRHILVRIDPGQVDPKGGNWTNSANDTYQHGDLVTEPVCISTPTQTDAVSVCAGYHNPTYVPSVGDHVIVSGSWVLDTNHGWLEIHPAVYQLI
jgi:hypothetical protein